jgi:hypothetical protein
VLFRCTHCPFVVVAVEPHAQLPKGAAVCNVGPSPTAITTTVHVSPLRRS